LGNFDIVSQNIAVFLTVQAKTKETSLENRILPGNMNPMLPGFFFAKKYPGQQKTDRGNQPVFL